MFRLLVEVGVLEAIGKLPQNKARNIRDRVKQLAENPFPDGYNKKEIKGTTKSVYRLRVGDYRVFYVLDNVAKEVKVTGFLTAEQAHGIYGRL
jgi:mRNA-degrading endonuclease RelE of RelBE toxin-antitoxin system